ADMSHGRRRSATRGSICEFMDGADAEGAERSRESGIKATIKGTPKSSPRPGVTPAPYPGLPYPGLPYPGSLLKKKVDTAAVDAAAKKLEKLALEKVQEGKTAKEPSPRTSGTPSGSSTATADPFSAELDQVFQKNAEITKLIATPYPDTETERHVWDVKQKVYQLQRLVTRLDDYKSKIGLQRFAVVDTARKTVEGAIASTDLFLAEKERK